jgi:hypothetical protein
MALFWELLTLRVLANVKPGWKTKCLEWEALAPYEGKVPLGNKMPLQIHKKVVVCLLQQTHI